MIFFFQVFPLTSSAQNTLFHAGDDYQISIPDIWKEIPKDVLEQYGKALSEAMAQNHSFEYGYQLRENKIWFTHPYVLVQVKRTGRIPEGQLKNHKVIENELKKEFQKIEKTAGDFVSNSSPDGILYDPTIHTLWSMMTVDVQDLGKVKGLSAVKLTEYGYIQFIGYALENDFSQYEPLYRKMAQSIKIEDKDIYKPNFLDNAPTIFGLDLGQIVKASIIGGLLGGLTFLFNRLRKKKS